MKARGRQGASWSGGHLSDDALIALVVDGEPALGGDRPHLDTCPECQRRLDSTAEALHALGQALAVAADAQVSSQRLDRQLSSIERHLDGAVAPARVLRFPSPSRVFDAAHSAARRWVAAAAVAGLFVGLVAGRVFDPTSWLSGSHPEPRTAAQAFATPSGLGDIGISPAGLADEALLIEVDAAMRAPRIEPLATLDAMTPRAQDLPPGY